jgi:hypothetical protein
LIDWSVSPTGVRQRGAFARLFARLVACSNVQAGCAASRSGRRGRTQIGRSRVDLRDGCLLLLYPKVRLIAAHRLLSLGKTRGGEGQCRLNWGDVADPCELRETSRRAG